MNQQQQQQQQQYAMAMNQYRQLVQETQRLVSKISELEMDRNEHRLVEETLRPLDPDRKAYRLVGTVLVERNVREVLPSVTTNRENVRFMYYNGALVVASLFESISACVSRDPLYSFLSLPNQLSR